MSKNKFQTNEKDNPFYVPEDDEVLIYEINF